MNIEYQRSLWLLLRFFVAVVYGMVHFFSNSTDLTAQKISENDVSQEVKIYGAVGFGVLGIDDMNDRLTIAGYPEIESLVWNPPLLGIGIDYIHPPTRFLASLSYQLMNHEERIEPWTSDLKSHAMSIDLGYLAYQGASIGLHLFGGYTFGETSMMLTETDAASVHFDSALAATDMPQITTALVAQNQSFHVGGGIDYIIDLGSNNQPRNSRGILIGLRSGISILDASRWSVDGRVVHSAPSVGVPKWYLKLVFGYRMVTSSVL